MQSGQVLLAIKVFKPAAITSCALQVQLLPRAALLLATAGCSGSSSVISSSNSSGSPLSDLAVWAPGSAAQGLQLLAGSAGSNPAVRSYAIKCLFNERPEKVVTCAA
jgi:hypothetical protein